MNSQYLVLAGALLVLDYVLYGTATIAALHWGSMVRVAFDLYRDDLRRALYLPDVPDNALGKERAQWEMISKFLVFGEVGKFKGFVYSRPQDTDESGKSDK
jgi:hypothetical protein